MCRFFTTIYFSCRVPEGLWKAAHLLPGSSLTLDNDGTIGVRVVGEGDIARFLPVGILRDTIDGIWVTGLPETVNVIVTGQEYVTDGVPVLPTQREESEG